MTEAAHESQLPNLPEARGDTLSSSQESLPAKLGAELIIRFYRLLKAAAFYDRNNIHIKRLSLDFHETLKNFLQAEGHLSLKVIRDRFFFNNILMPMKADQYSILKNFSQEMAKKWIGEVEFAADGGRNR